ncbi:hypothetical protein BD309DRAFT_965308 [Dichomitus squalens]|uniref:Uncharacterized protein n=1 Tax=Dichomitus squalens TaxID=114155 RepID=A0A4Q9PBI9_9APHY|nr:hypothetical protein BD309DRAFT_965308 [Dichomitus squalens]TBU52100.1 hypothetical protein BD310DRAFT_941003 [Dichomitus squalens]
MHDVCSWVNDLCNASTVGAFWRIRQETRATCAPIRSFIRRLVKHSRGIRRLPDRNARMFLEATTQAYRYMDAIACHAAPLCLHRARGTGCAAPVQSRLPSCIRNPPYTFSGASSPRRANAGEIRYACQMYPTRKQSAPILFERNERPTLHTALA